MNGTGARVYVVSGPSGAGKGTLIQKALKRADGVAYSISATTRPMGRNEAEGKDYHFLTDGEFDRLLEQDGFLEWEEVYGSRYGTLRSEVDEALAGGRSIILELDTKGALNIRGQVTDAVLVFIMPPSIDELEARIRHRRRGAGEAIETRIAAARREIEAGRSFDHVIVNNEIESAAGKLLEIIKGE